MHRVYPIQGQEAFLEVHIDALEEIGGVPTRHLRYDNLTDAVSTVLYGTADGAQRTSGGCCSARTTASTRSTASLESRVAHEKGGVEGDVGRFRRTHLSPTPVVDSLAELNEQIKVWDRADEHRRVRNRIRTVEQDYALDRAALAPLPADLFDPGLVLNHGWTGRAWSGSGWRATRSRPGCLTARSASRYVPRRWSCSTATPRSRAIPAWWPGTARVSTGPLP